MAGLLRYYSVIFIAILFSGLTSAASLQVFPVNINFSAGENVKAIYVNNTGSAPINAQVRVYKWSQNGDNDVLTETQDIVISPPMTAIPAGKQQLLRVILPVPPAGENEQSYKLVVDELPGEGENNKNHAVRFLLRYTLPVFINSPDTSPEMKNFTFHLDAHSIPARLWIDNNGPKHLKLSNVILTSGHNQIPLSKGLLGYVLAHSTRSWSLPKGKYTGTSLTFTTNDDTTSKTVPILNQ